MLSWDDYFLRMAGLVAEKSKDRSTKVGCVLVGPNNEVRSTGFNGFPRGVNDDVDARHERPAKYAWTEHAERNAIYNAARHGTPLDGCKAYVQLFPCIDCARALVQAGISEVISIEPDLANPIWGESFETSLALFKEAGLTVRYVCEAV
jgi:dCMP deaminase